MMIMMMMIMRLSSSSSNSGFIIEYTVSINYEVLLVDDGNDYDSLMILLNQVHCYTIKIKSFIRLFQAESRATED